MKKQKNSFRKKFLWGMTLFLGIISISGYIQYKAWRDGFIIGPKIGSNGEALSHPDTFWPDKYYSPIPPEPKKQPSFDN